MSPFSFAVIRGKVRNDIRATVESSGGMQEFDQALANDDELAAALNLQAVAIRKTARALLNRSAGNGRVYVTHANGSVSVHRASAPGEAPTSVSGALARKITITRARNKPGKKLLATVSARALEAYWLEFGTVNMRPRPFLGPALKVTRMASMAALRAGATRAVQKAAARAAAKAARQ